MTATNSSSRKLLWGGGYGIVEVVDELLAGKPTAAALAVNLHAFGSAGQDKADLSRGVLERFTRRAPKDWSAKISANILGGNVHVKTLANPRKINCSGHPHFPLYFEEYHSVNENGKIVLAFNNNPVTAEKLVINHYFAKSHEEFLAKQNRGRADNGGKQSDKLFQIYNRNEEFDDGILKYRAARAKKFRPPDLAHVNERLLNALMKNLSPTLIPNTPQKFYAGKMETFLTCRAVAAYLQTKLTDSTPAKFFEEAALKATLRSIGGMTFADARLFLRELPKLLSLPYPAVKDLRQIAVGIIPQMMNVMKTASLWREFVELDYLQDLLKFKGE